MDNWEEEADRLAAETTTGLNINACEFVPGQAFNFSPVKVATPDTNGVAIVEEANLKEISEEEKVPEPVTKAPTVKSEKPEMDDKNIASSAVIDGDAQKELEDSFIEEQRKDTLNLVFIGHVDAGKSTIGGHLLYLTGMVDQRTLEKYEREAKEKNRDTWYLSWALDTFSEEREKGKTVECGRAYFETENKRFVLLDAPGHRSFVPSMISGAIQADLAILVISARKGEFETGFEKGGQTQEHVMLVKTAGVKFLVVLINKMDDPTVQWSEARYNHCKDSLEPFLRKQGFPKKDYFFMPCSGQTGALLRDVPDPNPAAPWYAGPPLLTYLDTMKSLKRCTDGPLRMTISNRYKDQQFGTFVFGKIESGQMGKGQSLLLMPNRITVEAVQLQCEDQEVSKAVAGDNVKVQLKNVDESEISPGFVLCRKDNICTTGSAFEAEVHIRDYKSIMAAGFTAIMHLHAVAEEVEITKLVCTLTKNREIKTMKPKFIKQDDKAVVRFSVKAGSICLEPFKTFPQMGRFTLRDENKTIAQGIVRKVFPPSGAGIA